MTIGGCRHECLAQRSDHHLWGADSDRDYWVLPVHRPSLTEDTMFPMQEVLCPATDVRALLLEELFVEM